MPIVRTYKCPDCRGTFEFMHHPSNEPPPSECPLCNSDMTGGTGETPKHEFVPHINLGTAKGKVPDQLFKTMMAASEERTKDAADMLGVSVSDVPGIKITDMNDNLREGDVAAKRDPWAENRIKQRAEEAAAQSAAALSHVRVGNQMVPTGAPPGHSGVTRIDTPRGQISPEAQAWASETAAGPAALHTRRTLIDTMQATGEHGRRMAAVTHNGMMHKA